jgi:phosphatidylglycerol:prolipoprotein diacylglycerol transferase
VSVYWTFYLLTWIAVAVFFAWRARRHRVPAAAVLDGVIYVLPALVVGGHLLSAFLGLGEIEDWRAFFFTVEGWRAGHVSFGALAGALGALWLAARLHGLPGPLLIDLAMPGLFVASPLMRTGCFFTGCCFGAPTAMPWGVRFPLDHPFEPWTAPSHPTQLYEAAASLLVLAALPWLLRRLSARPGDGTTALLCALLFFLERFVIEFFRVGGTTVAVYRGLSEPHFVTLAGFLLCAGLLAWRLRRVRQPAAALPLTPTPASGGGPPRRRPARRRCTGRSRRRWTSVEH